MPNNRQKQANEKRKQTNSAIKIIHVIFLGRRDKNFENGNIILSPKYFQTPTWLLKNDNSLCLFLARGSHLFYILF